MHSYKQSAQEHNARYAKYLNTSAMAEVLHTASARSKLECARICTELDNCTAYHLKSDLMDNRQQCEMLNMTGGCGTMPNSDVHSLYGKFCIMSSMCF